MFSRIRQFNRRSNFGGDAPNSRKRQGFTFVELSLVVGILGVASLALVQDRRQEVLEAYSHHVNARIQVYLASVSNACIQTISAGGTCWPFDLSNSVPQNVIPQAVGINWNPEANFVPGGGEMRLVSSRSMPESAPLSDAVSQVAVRLEVPVRNELVDLLLPLIPGGYIRTQSNGIAVLAAIQPLPPAFVTHSRFLDRAATRPITGRVNVNSYQVRNVAQLGAAPADLDRSKCNFSKLGQVTNDAVLFGNLAPVFAEGNPATGGIDDECNKFEIKGGAMFYSAWEEAVSVGVPPLAEYGIPASDVPSSISMYMTQVYGELRIGRALETINYFHFSDERLKEGIEDLQPKETRLLDKIRAVTFKDRDAFQRSRIGYLAQDVQKYYPGLVHQGGESDDETLAVEYDSLIPIMVARYREQQALIVNLREQITALESRQR